MFSIRLKRKAFASASVSFASLFCLLVFGCGNDAPPPAGDPAARSGGSAMSGPSGMTSAPPTSIAPPSGPVTAGSDFNKRFPKSDGNYKVVFTQEKKGFAQAELQQNGKRVATLSISDVAANPEAVSKYNSSGKQLAGFPAASVGSQGTSILVNGKYQVQVRSTAPTFSATDREAWIQKFDLNGLR